MKRNAKILIVVGGYAAALLIAVAVVSLYVVVMDSPERDASSGMSAFSDVLFFLTVFGLAVIPPTCAMLYFLRPIRAFWRVAAVASLAVAATGIAAWIDFLPARGYGGVSSLAEESVLTPLRWLASPLFGFGFFLSFCFAPTRGTRFSFLGATAIEAIVFVSVALMLFSPFR